MKRHVRLSKDDMIGFTVLMLVILAGLLIFSYKEKIWDSTNSSCQLGQEEIDEIEMFAKQIKADSLRHARRFEKKAKSFKALTPFTFDPNTADSTTLSRLGLKHWQISNLIKYRNKGGKWRNAKDFAKLYGLSDRDFKTLEPYIHIQKTEEDILAEQKKTQKDSILKSYPKKYEEGSVVLQLNEADTTALKGIPGIGSYYASKICRYRERLGGFVSVDQLKEIEGLPKDIGKWFSLSKNTTIRKTNINRTDFKGLIRHPYLNYEQVKDICKYIRKFGKIHSLDDLSNSKNFTPEDIQRLRPYISFE